MENFNIVQEVFASAGGGLIAGSIAWVLFWITNKRNIELADARINSLETATKECEKDRREIHSEFHKFQTQVIAQQREFINAISKLQIDDYKQVQKNTDPLRGNR